MSNIQPHRLTGRAYREAREDAFNHKARTALRRKERLYWVVNTATNRRSSKPVTMEGFLDYIGRKKSVASQYQLVEAK